jgi:GAF domain-containing protein
MTLPPTSDGLLSRVGGRQAGAGSSISVPLMIDTNAVGALNLYSRMARGLTAQDQARARQFADQAAGAIALARRLEEREQFAGHLEKALSSRSVIDQALGVIIARTGYDAEHAFQLLRAQSQHTNEKLPDVAARIVQQASTRAR